MAIKDYAPNRGKKPRRKRMGGYLRSGSPRVSEALQETNPEYSEKNLPMFGMQIRHTINVIRRAIENAKEARRKKAVLEETQGE